MSKKLLILFFGFFALSVNAQDISKATDIEKKLAQVNVETLANKLMLSVNQKEKLLSVVTAYEMNKNIIFKSEGEMDDKNKKLEELEKEHHTKVEELLNEQQFEKFNALVAEVKSGNS